MALTRIGLQPLDGPTQWPDRDVFGNLYDRHTPATLHLDDVRFVVLPPRTILTVEQAQVLLDKAPIVMEEPTDAPPPVFSPPEEPDGL